MNQVFEERLILVRRKAVDVLMGGQRKNKCLEMENHGTEMSDLECQT